nr:hypothetical protein [uncultured Rhodopila sp.]
MSVVLVRPGDNFDIIAFLVISTLTTRPPKFNWFDSRTHGGSFVSRRRRRREPIANRGDLVQMQVHRMQSAVRQYESSTDAARWTQSVLSRGSV